MFLFTKAIERVQLSHLLYVLVLAWMLFPVLSLLHSLFSSLGFETQSIAFFSRSLPAALTNLVVLMLVVSLLSGCIGVSLALITVHFDFWGRRFFEWALISPIVLPIYLLAFVYVGLLDFSSGFSEFLRSVVGFDLSFILDWNRLILASFVMSLGLYPYIYIASRNAFRKQCCRLGEASKSLGKSFSYTVFRIYIPLAAAWIFSGLVLVNMEILAEFGAVSILGLETMTTAIYKAWYSYRSFALAAKISCFLAVLSLILLGIQNKVSRGAHTMESKGEEYETCQPKRLGVPAQTLAISSCALVFLFAIIIPVTQLLTWAVMNFKMRSFTEQFDVVWNTFFLAICIASLTSLIAFCLHYYSKRKAFLIRLSLPFVLIGYSLPGSVIAIGTLIPLIHFDHMLTNWLYTYLLEKPVGENLPLLLSGSLFALVMGLVIRFQALSFLSIKSASYNIKQSMEDASQSLNLSKHKKLLRIDIPIMWPGIVAGFCLVLIEVMKEMPFTVLARPSGLETLSTRIYELTSEGEWALASYPALFIVVIGFLSLILMNRNASL